MDSKKLLDTGIDTPVFFNPKIMRHIMETINIFIVLLFVFEIYSCEKDYLYQTPPPPKSDPTSTLEAVHVSVSPNSLTSVYWGTADYLKVNSLNVSTNLVYNDGLLNMTGIFNGLTSFSKGADAGLKLKAAYDNDNLYILAEWTDSTLNLSNASWLYGGPTDAKKPGESTAGWTSQRNSDKIALAFEINNASSNAGTFANVGCAASCHANGNNSVMHPDFGTADLWNWDLARTAPMGYAQDMNANTGNFSDDSGQPIASRNVNGTTSRSGPAYEYSGTSQNVTLPNGQASILDATYYLFNKTAFTGDISRGDSIYHRTIDPGDCASCHGPTGAGGVAAGPVNSIGLNAKSRAALSTSMDNIQEMSAHWGPLNSNDRNDVIAYLRGLSGVPGYYLNTPTGSNADIKALSNVTALQIKESPDPRKKHTIYKVLFIRKLKTNNADDAQFDVSPGKTYTFGVALMDNDGRNHIGSTKETLTFK